jgi:hypothetical protein
VAHWRPAPTRANDKEEQSLIPLRTKALSLDPQIHNACTNLWQTAPSARGRAAVMDPRRRGS